MTRFVTLFLLAFLFVARAAICYDNILMITIDTLRADYLSCYGSTKVKTPNIDALAAKGTLFQNAVTSAPLTMPAHASLFTGLNPTAHGVRDNGFRLDRKFSTLAEQFQAQGFQTAAFVASFSVDSRFALDQGFQTYDDSYPLPTNLSAVTVSERKASDVIGSAMPWIQSHRGKKWFVWIHLFDPHYPYKPPAEFIQMYASDPYAGEVAFVDQQIGRLSSLLDTSTLVVITADHGESLGDHGETTHGIFAYQQTMRIPLIIAPHKNVSTSSRARIIDIAPTVIELMGLPSKTGMQGIDLFSHPESDRDSYFEAQSMHLTAGWAPLQGFYSGDFKYIDLPIPELYDLKTDSFEQKNLCTNVRLCEEWRKKFTAEFALQSLPVAPALDPSEAERLKALGYISAGTRGEKKPVTLADDPKNLISLHSRVYAALMDFNQGRATRAIETLEKVIHDRNDYWEAYYILSFIQQTSDHPEQAVQTVKRAIANGVTLADAEGKLGLYLFQAQKYEDAVQHLQNALRTDPYNITHLNFLALAYEKTGAIDAAEKAFEQALQIDSTDGMSLNNFGSFYLRQKKLDAAAGNFQAALEHNLYIINSYKGVASVREMQNKWKEAIRWWQALLKIEPEDCDALLHLGLDFLQLAQKEDALKYLRRFEDHASPDRYRAVLPRVRTLIEQLKK